MILDQRRKYSPGSVRNVRRDSLIEEPYMIIRVKNMPIDSQDKTAFYCFHCNKLVTTSTMSLLRTRLCADHYMQYGITVPKEFWVGDTADQQLSYMTELGLCIVCNRQTTKKCKLCLKWNCRPTEWSGDCMERHLIDDHGVLFKTNV